MTEQYRVIRSVEYGGAAMSLAQGTDGSLVYLVSPALPLTVVYEGGAVPSVMPAASAGGRYRVIPVPMGHALEEVAGELSAADPISILKALTSALEALDDAGFPLPAGAVDERVILRNNVGSWQLDFVAACLAMTPDVGARLPDPAGDVTRLCFRLLPRITLSGGSSKELRLLQHICQVQSPKTLGEWRAALARLSSRNGPARRGRGWAAILGALVLGLLVGATRFLLPVDDQPAPSASPARAQPQAAREPLPPSGQEVKDVVLYDRDSQRAEFQRHMRVQSAGTPDAPTTVAPPAPPRLPGPYCEESSLETRYLVVNGNRLCTAHIVWGEQGMYISHLALSKVALVEGVPLQKAEFTSRDGLLWISLSNETLRKFGFRQTRPVDSTTIYLGSM